MKGIGDIVRKETKKCIKYYLRHINSAEYEKEKIKRDKEFQKSHQEYVEKEKPQWKNRTDYNEEAIITGVALYDTLSNEGVKKLLKKLYSLPKKKFKVKNYYEKPTIVRNYDYVHLQYSHSNQGIFAEIIFLDDIYIDKVRITWSQINNYYAFLNINLNLKKVLMMICIGSLFVIAYKISQQKITLNGIT